MNRREKRARSSLNVDRLNAKNFTTLTLHFTTIAKRLIMDSFPLARYSMEISLMARLRTEEGLE
jgi:hypothetical protein